MSHARIANTFIAFRFCRWSFAEGIRRSYMWLMEPRKTRRFRWLVWQIGAENSRKQTMRRAAKRDANEPEIINAIRAVGGRVQQISAKGVPDLLVAYCGKLALFEVKDGSKPPSERELTKDQVEFHNQWLGAPIFIVKNVQEAILALNVMRRKA